MNINTSFKSAIIVQQPKSEMTASVYIPTKSIEAVSADRTSSKNKNMATVYTANNRFVIHASFDQVVKSYEEAVKTNKSQTIACI